jgi:hypothetical protein
MITKLRWIVGCGLVISALAAGVVSAEIPAAPELQAFLRKELAFTPSELSALDAGQTIVRLPKTAETREVAAFAVMRLNVPREFFLHKMRDIANFKKSENVLQIGRFSDPPRLEDLAGLTLDTYEIDTIRRCRPRKCDFKLSGAFIERFRKEVNWSSPGYQDRASTLMREMMLEYVRGYLSGGNPALGEYNDKSYKLNLADELQTLLQPASYTYGYSPEFQKYLSEFPQARPAHVENFVYWSKEKFGLKPVISITHISAHKVSPVEGADVVIASKGIYANHYFEASLGLTAFVHSAVSNQPRTYLIYINRSKADALRGMFAGFKRSLISGSLRNGAKKNMEMIKQKLESEFEPANNRERGNASPPKSVGKP